MITDAVDRTEDTFVSRHNGPRAADIEDMLAELGYDSLDALMDAVSYCRDRKGPALVRANVTRPYSHSMSDDDRAYRPEGEREADAKKDCLRLMRRSLIDGEIATAEELARWAQARFSEDSGASNEDEVQPTRATAWTSGATPTCRSLTAMSAEPERSLLTIVST